MSDVKSNHPDSPTYGKDVPVPPRDHSNAPCYWNGKQYEDGKCCVQNGFWAYVCQDGRWIYNGPPSACPDYKEEEL